MQQSELDELIEAYESEKQNLEAFLGEALEEKEYYLAQYYQQGLYKLRIILENLYHFRDPFYKEKIDLQRSIDHSRQYPDHPVFRDYIVDLERQKMKLQELLSKDPFVIPNENELTEALHDLVEGKNQGFKLHLRRKFAYYIEMRNIDSRYLLISIPIDSETMYGIYPDCELLARRGFVLKAEQKKMEYVYDLSGFRSTHDIKLLLAKIIFEYSQYRNFDKPAAIEYL